ncbi:MAG TPA: alpha/beta hydrolase [Acidimicrobiia bacterium]
MFEAIGLSLGRVSADTVPPGIPVELAGRGTVLAYDVTGPVGAPTLVLLHGLGATGTLNWFPSFGPLSERFRVVAMDLRGHGYGLKAGAQYRLADCADDAIALIDALGIDRCIPVGYSLGGPVAQLMWHRHRDRVEGLVLCATSRNFAGHPVEQWGFRGLAGLVMALRLADALPWPKRAVPVETPPPEPEVLDGMRLPQWAMAEMRRCDPVAMIGAVTAIGRFSSHAWVGSIDVPTAVVVTLRDRFVSAARQLKLAQAIPGATIHPVDSDHAACVLGARRFVPALVTACGSVADRLGDVPRVA